MPNKHPKTTRGLDIFTATMIVEGEQEINDDQEYIDACQTLIDTGVAWQLQGYFGRACMSMIEAGQCTLKETDA